MCGGTRRINPVVQQVKGLSPRVRGNRAVHQARRTQGRSIPACAGEPGTADSAAPGRWVYPRVCGGTANRCLRHSIPMGLSPRVRGNPAVSLRPGWRPGSIPACAGEPCITAPSRPASRVYPRVCGGTRGQNRHPLRWRGLSPRVRGNLPVHGRHPVPGRSIPACAGEPGSLVALTAHSDGLSPRVRGNLLCNQGRIQGRGSIPACAGEPRYQHVPGLPCPVYPRVCGGTSNSSRLSISFAGLSPRVRGNPEDLTGEQRPQGSIPACAGEPVSVPYAAVFAEVYPRVCGGTC